MCSPTRGPLCGDCFERLLAESHGPVTYQCQTCSIPLPPRVGVCERCRRETYAFSRLTAACPYRGVAARVLREVKFHSRRSLIPLLVELVSPLVHHDSTSVALVPAPSRRSTIRRRGFSVGRELATALGRKLHLDVLDLLRQRSHAEQKKLAYEGRWSNMLRSVRAVRARHLPQTAIVVDDVFTTGATANACAVALKEIGVQFVEVVTFAMEY